MAINKRLIKSNEGGAELTTSFNTVLYNGNSSTQSITGVGFQPDLVWIKDRDRSVWSHILVDSVRNATNQLSSDNNDLELVRSSVTSFNSDGFSVGNYIPVNDNGYKYVAWCWKAGGSAVTNTDGTITSQVSANAGAGFSVVSYTGNGVNNSTFGHGISGIDMVIIKNRDAIENWATWHSSLPSVNSYMYLDGTGATGISTQVFRGTSSSTVTIGTHPLVNVNNNKYIAYCFAEVAGFSKFGSYSGTDSAGNYVETGFEPAFVLIKRSIAGAGNWIMKDNKRNPTNPVTNNLYANLTNEANDITTLSIDFNPLGFTVNGASGDVNDTGTNNYIYMAFANQF